MQRDTFLSHQDISEDLWRLRSEEDNSAGCGLWIMKWHCSITSYWLILRAHRDRHCAAPCCFNSIKQSADKWIISKLPVIPLSHIYIALCFKPLLELIPGSKWSYLNSSFWRFKSVFCDITHLNSIIFEIQVNALFPINHKQSSQKDLC